MYNIEYPVTLNLQVNTGYPVPPQPKSVYIHQPFSLPLSTKSNLASLNQVKQIFSLSIMSNIQYRQIRKIIPAIRSQPNPYIYTNPSLSLFPGIQIMQT